MKFFIPIIVGLIIFVGCNCASLPIKTILRETTPSVVLVQTEGGGMCTGFVVGPNLVATAGHCVESLEKTLFLIDIYGNTYAAIPRIDDDSKDIAILESFNLNHPALILGEIPEIGERLLTIGFPGYGRGNQLFEVGYLKRIKEFKNVTLLYSHEIVYRGESGGPVLNEFGQAVGMVVGIEENNNEISIMVSIKDIKTVLGF